MLRQTILLGIAIAAGTAACSGCGDTAARQLATDTLQTTVVYEKDINDKVNAEKGFYATQHDNLIQPLFGYVPVDQRTSIGAAVSNTSDFSVTESLYYGTIVVSAQRDGVLLADKIITSNDKGSLTPLFAYLDDGVKQERDTYNALVQRQVQLSIHLSSGLSQLNAQTAKLDAVRQQLVALSQKQSTNAQLQQLIELGTGVRKILADNKTSTGAKSASSSPKNVTK